MTRDDKIRYKNLTNRRRRKGLPKPTWEEFLEWKETPRPPGKYAAKALQYRLAHEVVTEHEMVLFSARAKLTRIKIDAKLRGMGIG